METDNKEVPLGPKVNGFNQPRRRSSLSLQPLLEHSVSSSASSGSPKQQQHMGGSEFGEGYHYATGGRDAESPPGTPRDRGGRRAAGGVSCGRRCAGMVAAGVVLTCLLVGVIVYVVNPSPQRRWSSSLKQKRAAVSGSNPPLPQLEPESTPQTTTTMEEEKNAAATNAVFQATARAIHVDKPPQPPKQQQQAQQQQQHAAGKPLRELHPNDLAIWQKFYDITGGPHWRHCSEAREDPCACKPQVTCAVQPNGQKRIVELSFRNNRLNGYLPSEHLSNLPALDFLDVSSDILNSGRNRFHENAMCVHMHPCATRMICNLQGTGLELCEKPASEFMKREQKKPLIDSDQVSWWVFYDSMNGDNWSECAGARNDPCDLCAAHVECVFDARQDGYKIRSIRFRGETHLVGWIPDHVMDQFAHLEVFDLGVVTATPSTKLNDVLNEGCLEMQSCYTRVACTFDGLDVKLCPQMTKMTTTGGGASSTTTMKAIEPEQSQTILAADEDPAKTASAASKRLNERDFIVWQILWDATDGPRWSNCYDSRNDPCGCKEHVTCARARDAKAGDETVFIESLLLAHVGLTGWFPVEAVSSLKNLRFLDIGNPNDAHHSLMRDSEIVRNRLWNAGCLDLPQCESDGMMCQFSGLDIGPCSSSNNPIPQDLSPPSPLASSPPSEMSTCARKQLVHTEQLAWHAFFDSMDGPEWVKCSKSREDPCGTCAEFVTCAPVRAMAPSRDNIPAPGCTHVYSITGLRLPSNGLYGWLSRSVLSQFPNLAALDLSNTGDSHSVDNGVVNFEPCLLLAGCGAQMRCNLQGVMKLCEPKASRALSSSASLAAEDGDESNSADDDKVDLQMWAHHNRRRRVRNAASRDGARKVNATDLFAFRALYDTLGGKDWRTCRTSRQNPCRRNGCDGLTGSIICEMDEDTGLRIVHLALPSNGLVGRLPLAAIRHMDKLKYLDFSNPTLSRNDNTMNAFNNRECLALPACTSSTCLFARTNVRLCDGTESPTPAVDSASQLVASDLLAWQTLYNALDGSQWSTCVDSYEDPCSTNNGCDPAKFLTQRIQCSVVAGKLRLVDISLKDVGASGILDSLAFSKLTAIENFDLSTSSETAQNPNLLENTSCVNLPLCFTRGVFCDIGGTGAHICPH